MFVRLAFVRCFLCVICCAHIALYCFSEKVGGAATRPAAGVRAVGAENDAADERHLFQGCRFIARRAVPFSRDGVAQRFFLLAADVVPHKKALVAAIAHKNRRLRGRARSALFLCYAAREMHSEVWFRIGQHTSAQEHDLFLIRCRFPHGLRHALPPGVGARRLRRRRRVLLQEVLCRPRHGHDGAHAQGGAPSVCEKKPGADAAGHG